MDLGGGEELLQRVLHGLHQHQLEEGEGLGGECDQEQRYLLHLDRRKEVQLRWV